MESEQQRLLIVNADEFGRSEGINRGIIEAHRRGIVTSASAMVRRPAANQAAALSQECPTLSIGLHLDLCDWEYRDGEWILIESVVPLDDGDQLAEEILFQLASFRALFSRDPTHIDSHQDVHRSDPTRSLLLTVARKLGIPLRHFVPEIQVCTELQAREAATDDAAGAGAVQRLRRIIAELPPGCTELVCRPSCDEEARHARERRFELDALCAPEVRRELRERGVERVSFHEWGRKVDSAEEGPEPTLRDRGRNAYDRRDFHQAIYWFRRETEVAADRPWPWLWLARAQIRAGDLIASGEAVDRALDVSPGWPPALLHLCDLHLESGDQVRAAQVLEKLALDHGDGRVGSRIARGIVRRVHRLDDARAALRVARALAQQHPDEDTAVAAEAIGLWRNGEAEIAIRNLDTSRSVRAAAEIAVETGKPRRAWHLLRSIELTDQDRELLTRIGHALRREGDLTGAWEALDRTISLGAADPVIRHWRDVVLGEVHVLSGVWTPDAPNAAGFEAVPGRVLHIVERSTPHASDADSVRTNRLARAQKDLGLDPQVVTQLGFPWEQALTGEARCDEIDGVPHHRMAPPLSSTMVPARLDQRLALNARALGELVQRARPAVLHAGPDYRNALLALALKRRCGVPVVYEPRGLPPLLRRASEGGAELGNGGPPLAHRWRLARELECMRGADRVVVETEATRAALLKHGIRDETLVVIPPVVDVEAFRPGPQDRALARSLGLRQGEVVLGAWDRPDDEDAIDLVLEAVARFCHGGSPVRGLFLGEAGARKRILQRAVRLGIEDRVAVTASLSSEKLPALYRLIDVFVHAHSATPAWPTSTAHELLQAMASGRTLVTADAHGQGDMIIPGLTGFPARPGDADHLVEVLEPLVASQDRRAGVGRAARRWVTENRTGKISAEHHASVYASLETAPRAPVDVAPRLEATAALRIGPRRAELPRMKIEGSLGERRRQRREEPTTPRRGGSA